jgi:hypothetical protein
VGITSFRRAACQAPAEAAAHRRIAVAIKIVTGGVKPPGRGRCARGPVSGPKVGPAAARRMLVDLAADGLIRLDVHGSGCIGCPANLYTLADAETVHKYSPPSTQDQRQPSIRT